MPEQQTKLKQAVSILRAGGLVAFPTETVYGLGADATSSRAVRKIFAAKGRPRTNPLIVHVTGIPMAKRCAANWPPAAQRLAKKFWPGPLTLVLPKARQISSQATAGQPTVALRAPNHPLALRLLRRFNKPIAAPSANRSTRISPTTADHVLHELGHRVQLILDGGPCNIGIESTVLDLSPPRPILLRPGAIQRHQIEKLIGPIDVLSHNSKKKKYASPGLHRVHYSPITPAYQFNSSDLKKITDLVRRKESSKYAILVMDGSTILSPLKPFRDRIQFIKLPRTPAAYARRFYAALHAADALGLQSIWIEHPPETPPWHAVNDRIRRATKPASAHR